MSTAERFPIRSATQKDLEAILECLHSAFAPYRDQYTPEGFLDTVLTIETLRQRMTEMSVFVATHGHEIVGTIACAVSVDEGHLRGMAVRPEWQGVGVSACLLEHALAHFRSAGCSFVTLDTTEPLRRAIRFYEKNGFQSTGKVSDFFGMSLFEYSRKL